MKTCSKCSNDHPDDFFNWKDKSRGRRSGVCKGCTRLYANRYYDDNADKMKQNSMRSNRRRIQDNRLNMLQYLMAHPCVDCGEPDPMVLDPDHMYDKKYMISTMLRYGHTWNEILRELDKCEIRCANCHRRRTAKTQQWGKYILYMKMATRLGGHQ